MLPMLLSLLGSGIAGTSALGGIAAGMSPLVAGAIGSGVGSLIETGDLGEGIKSGLLSFAGGKALGSLMNGASTKALESGSVPTTSAVSASPHPMPRPMPSPENLASLGASSAPKAGGLIDIGKRGLEFGKTAAGVGSGVGAMLSPAISLRSSRGSDDSDEARPLPEAPDMSGVRFPTADWMGTSEFNYNFPGAYVSPMPYAGGGMLARYARPSMMGMEARLAEGGLASLAEADLARGTSVEPPMDMPMEPPQRDSTSTSPNDKEIVVGAVEAIKSGAQDDMSKIALATFMQRFGKDALMDLVESVQRGDFDNIADANEGMISGPGDAMDDLVPAKNTESGEDILLSGGEFIVPGDVVSGLGNGSSDAGADKLYRMMDRVRMARTGTTEQAPQIKAGGMLPA
jgi:hypothetical protein